MNDLNTINRLNQEAFADAIAKLRAAGKHVLAQYEGLHLYSIQAFDTADQLVDAHAAGLRAWPPATGTSFKAYPALAPAPSPAETPVPQRDQSEDTGASFATVQDYLRHVAGPHGVAIVFRGRLG